VNLCLRSRQLTLTFIPLTNFNPVVVLYGGGSSAATNKCCLQWRAFLVQSAVIFNCTTFGTECWSPCTIAYTQRVWERIRTSLFDIVSYNYWMSSGKVKLTSCNKMDQQRFRILDSIFREVHLRKMKSNFSLHLSEVKGLENVSLEFCT